MAKGAFGYGYGYPVSRGAVGGGAPALPPLNAPRAIPLNIMHSGASHTNTTQPTYIDRIAEYFGSTGDVTTSFSIINGSTWQYRWENDATDVNRQGPSARQAVEAGTPDVLAICDNSASTFPSSLFSFGALWRDACEANNIEMFVWSIILTGDVGLESYANPLDVPNSVWEAVRDKQLLRDGQWANVVQFLRNTSSSPVATPIRFIPWAKILARIIDGWLKGQAPSGFRPEQMIGRGTTWQDNHPSALGRWCIALAHFAVIWRRDPTLVPTPVALGIDTSAAQDTMLATTSNAIYAWLSGIIWDVCQNEPLAEVRQWNATPDFLLLSNTAGQAQLYRTPELDPAALPPSFDAALRLEGDPGAGTVQTGLTTVPVTWTGLATGNYQARRHPSGQWSPPVAVKRVVPSVVQIVAEMPLHSGAAGVSLVNNWLQITDLPAGTQVGDIALWVGMHASATQSLIFSSDILTPFPSRAYSTAGGNTQARVAAGVVASLTGTFRFANFNNDASRFLGALYILRGASLSTIVASNFDARPAGTDSYVEMPALTPIANSSIEIITAWGRQSGGGIGFITPDGYTTTATRNAFTEQHRIMRRLVDAGALERPFLNFPGSTGTTSLQTLRLAIGPA